MAATGNRTLGLGIDTGGTFTDAAIIDMDTMEVLTKAKSPTTYQDLSIGLLGAVDGVIATGKFAVDEIKIVGLSTTLATNSILTGKGGRGAHLHRMETGPGMGHGHQGHRVGEGGHTVRGMNSAAGRCRSRSGNFLHGAQGRCHRHIGHLQRLQP